MKNPDTHEWKKRPFQGSWPPLKKKIYFKKKKNSHVIYSTQVSNPLGKEGGRNFHSFK